MADSQLLFPGSFSLGKDKQTNKQNPKNQLSERIYSEIMICISHNMQKALLDWHPWTLIIICSYISLTQWWLMFAVITLRDNKGLTILLRKSNYTQLMLSCCLTLRSSDTLKLKLWMISMVTLWKPDYMINKNVLTGPAESLLVVSMWGQVELF